MDTEVTKKVQRFIDDFDKLLLKLDTFMSESLRDCQLSGYVELKRLELIDSIDYIQCFYNPSELLKNVLESMGQITVMDDANNNKSHSLPKRPCLCRDVDRFCVIPKSKPITAARLSNFERSLLLRMSSPYGIKFGAFMNELVVKNWEGWLHVDPKHKFYGVISDCIFCLFPSNDQELHSCMCIPLQGCTAQLARSRDPNALTISTSDEILYFSTDSRTSTSDCITWVNIGAQLSFKDLVTEFRSIQQNKVSAESQTASHTPGTSQTPTPATSQTSILRKQRVISERPEIDQKTKPSTESIPFPILQKEYVKSSQLTRAPQLDELDDSVTMRRETNRKSFEEGTGRHYLSMIELEKQREMRRQRCVSLQEPLERVASLSISKQEFPVTTTGALNNQRIGNSSLLSENTEKRRSLGSRIMRRAASLNIIRVNKSSKEKVPNPGSMGGTIIRSDVSKASLTSKQGKAYPDSPRTAKDMKSIQTEASKTRSGEDIANSEKKLSYEKLLLDRQPELNDASSLNPLDDLAQVCEIQGHLQCKRMLHWQKLYCIVYSGIFSLFKSIKSSSPEIQYPLKECLVIHVNEPRKPYAFKLVYQSKRFLILAAASSKDRESWFAIFNRYVRNALALSDSRGGSYALWQTNLSAAASYSVSPSSERAVDVLPVDNSFTSSTSSSASNLDRRSLRSVTITSESSDKDVVDGASNLASVDCVSEMNVSSAGLSDDTRSRLHTTAERNVSRISFNSDADVHPASATRSFSTDESKMRKLKAPFSKLKQDVQQAISKSMGDIPSQLSSSERSDTEEEKDAAGLRTRNSEGATDGMQILQKQIYSKQHLLEKIRQQKERIEEKLRAQEQQSTLHMDTEILKNITQLKQRRISTQLKYDYLEKQLGDKRRKKRESKASTKSQSNEEQIITDMQALKMKLDTYDKGLTQTNRLRDEAVSRAMRNDAVSSTRRSDYAEQISKQKIKGLESIIGTLDSSSQMVATKTSARRPHSDIHQSSYESSDLNDSGLSEQGSQCSPPQIRAETLAIINEFEVMTRDIASWPGYED